MVHDIAYFHVSHTGACKKTNIPESLNSPNSGAESIDPGLCGGMFMGKATYRFLGISQNPNSLMCLYILNAFDDAVNSLINDMRIYNEATPVTADYNRF